VRGSFTGADRDRIGSFETADGGTLFLDEIGELPIDQQPRLLRAVQEKKIRPVGSSSYRNVDVRLVAATRRDLPREINAGGFRSDLYFRLAQFRLELPPLRARKEDIPGLVAHIGRELGHQDADRRLSADALTRLMAHDWPGNVRELKNVVQVALAFAGAVGRVDVEEYMTPESRRINQARRVMNYELARAEAIADFERTYCPGREKRTRIDIGRPPIRSTAGLPPGPAASQGCASGVARRRARAR
jgi:DNA-binding NtrC family response regulator